MSRKTGVSEAPKKPQQHVGIVIFVIIGLFMLCLNCVLGYGLALLAFALAHNLNKTFEKELEIYHTEQYHKQLENDLWERQN